MIATAQASGATTRPRKTHVLYPSAVLGGIKRWIEIPQTRRDSRASLIRSPRVSWTDARLSLCGLLTRTVMATSAPMNSARRVMAKIRRPSGWPLPASRRSRGQSAAPEPGESHSAYLHVSRGARPVRGGRLTMRLFAAPVTGSLGGVQTAWDGRDRLTDSQYTVQVDSYCSVEF